jgi:hypothetical protein
MKTITLDEFFDKFKPQLNHINNPEGIEDEDDIEFSDYVYETYGEEDDYINSLRENEGKRIWTIMCYGINPMYSGWRFCDRLNYMVTEIPADDDYEVIDPDAEYDEDDELV